MQITAAPASSTFASPRSTAPTQPLALGTLWVRAAQRVAAHGSNTPERASDQSFVVGAHLARNAAEQLLKATPRTQFHYLDQAAAHALEGAALLEKASLARNAEFPLDVTLATIRDLSRRAFDAFEHALERIDND